jgi:hypothetical protein
MAVSKGFTLRDVRMYAILNELSELTVNSRAKARPTRSFSCYLSPIKRFRESENIIFNIFS